MEKEEKIDWEKRNEIHDYMRGKDLLEPKEESTPDQMPDFEAMAREFVKAHVRPGAGYIGEQIFTGLIPGLQEHTKRAFELIWKEHYLPLKEENKKLTELLELAKALKLLNESIRKDLQSELKNLREENERLQKRFDLRLLPPK